MAFSCRKNLGNRQPHETQFASPWHRDARTACTVSASLAQKTFWRNRRTAILACVGNRFEPGARGFHENDAKKLRAWHFLVAGLHKRRGAHLHSRPLRRSMQKSPHCKKSRKNHPFGNRIFK